MLYATLKVLHLLSLMVWMGGMFFMLFCLRPAGMTLPPPERVPLMLEAMRRFFAFVTAAIAVVLTTGLWMIGNVARATKGTGASFNMPLEWMVMAALGVLMMLVFAHIRVALYRRLQRAVAAQDWPAGGKALGEIRTWVIFNLAVGTFIVVVTLLGQA